MSEIGIEIKDTSDFPSGFILTSLCIPNTLDDEVPKISEMSILNTSSMPVMVTDVNGIVSKHQPIKITASFANMMGISSENEYVYIVERRLVDNNDLISTMNLNKKKLSKGELYNIIHKKITNLSLKSRNKELYIIYEINSKYLELKRSISLKEIGLTLSLPGYEKLPDGHHYNSIEKTIRNADHSKIVSSSIVYYHNDSKECVYINILNKIIRIDSVPIESEIEGEGIMMLSSDVTGMSKIFIDPKDFSKNNIYRSIKEAKESMSREDILARKKLDLEFLKTESTFINTLTNDVSTVYKNKMDLISKKNQIITDIEKVKTTKAKNTSLSTVLDNTKKYIDLILMIKKILLV